jgi:type I restriction enzyme S subunit
MYQISGKYPIIDQGQNLIAGYTDDESRVTKIENNPIIIFGDHTRIFKFIDFDFVAGADGTKAICPETALINPYFFYLILRNADFPNDGYNRHYKHLKKLTFKVPEKLEDQIAIACDLQSQLACVEAMRQAALKQKEAAKALQSAILREVFPWQAGESLPSGWRWEKLPNISKNLDGKRIPVSEKLREKGDIPYYGASGIVDYVKDYLFDEELLLVSEDGANLVMRTYPIAFSISGKTWVNNHAHVLKFEDRDIQKITEYYINGLDISDFVSGAAQPKLNQDNLNRIKIPIPVEPQVTCFSF